MPYATIIIPTHNRYYTLPMCVRSAQNQTVADLEILIVGDGVDPQTREVAEGLASSDPRIRFYDNPKGERSGIVHRNNAVLRASSDRIFYTDDDDLLLPHHVEVLGRQLDDTDMAESLPASVSHNGSIQVALANHSWPSLRQELAADRFKITYDTHVAHRQTSYRKLSAPWLSQSGTIAGSFLASFAASSQIKWKSTPMVTALSFHGAARRMLTATERAAELDTHARNLVHLDSSQFRFGWYLQFPRLLNSALWDGSSLSATINRLGFTFDENSKEGAGALLRLSLTPEQLEDAIGVFKLYQKAPMSTERLVKLIVQLSEPLQGGSPFCEHIASLAAACGVRKATKALLGARPANEYDFEIVQYLLFFLYKLAGQERTGLTFLDRLKGQRCLHEDYREALAQPALANKEDYVPQTWPYFKSKLCRFFKLRSPDS